MRTTRITYRRRCKFCDCTHDEYLYNSSYQPGQCSCIAAKPHAWHGVPAVRSPGWFERIFSTIRKWWSRGD